MRGVYGSNARRPGRRNTRAAAPVAGMSGPRRAPKCPKGTCWNGSPSILQRAKDNTTGTASRRPGYDENRAWSSIKKRSIGSCARRISCRGTLCVRRTIGPPGSGPPIGLSPALINSGRPISNRGTWRGKIAFSISVASSMSLIDPRLSYSYRRPLHRRPGLSRLTRRRAGTSDRLGRDASGHSHR